MATAETGQSALNELNNKFDVSKLSCSLLQKVRKLEINLKKGINCKWAVVFNRACIVENIMPGYVKNIYIFFLT